MKFEIENLIYQPRGIQKCNKMGGITDSTKRYGFWKKSLTNQSGVFYTTTQKHRLTHLQVQRLLTERFFFY
jgi:hypothetical protein